MTRGTLVCITNDTIWASQEFNGDMYPLTLVGDKGAPSKGDMAYKAMKKVKGFRSFVNTVYDFNHKADFNYSEDLIYCPVVGDRLKRDFYNMKEDYFLKWGSDYLYIRNTSYNDTVFIDAEGNHVRVNAKTGFLVLNYGRWSKLCRRISCDCKYD